MSDEEYFPLEDDSGDEFEGAEDSDEEQAEVSTENQPERVGVVGTSNDGMVWYKEPTQRTKNTAANIFRSPINKTPYTNHVKTAADAH